MPPVAINSLLDPCPICLETPRAGMDDVYRATVCWKCGFRPAPLFNEAVFVDGDVRLTGTGTTVATIAHTVVGAGGIASIDFENITQIYAHLRLVGSLRGTTAVASTTAGLRINDDAAASYYWQRLQGQAAATAALESLGASEGNFSVMPGSLAGAGLFASATIEIPDYTSAFRKMAMSQFATREGVATNQVRIGQYAIGWGGTVPITKLSLLPPADLFAEGSTATLYGLPPFT